MPRRTLGATVRRRPVAGPYGDATYDPDANTWRVRLNDAGRRQVEQFLARFKNNIAALVFTVRRNQARTLMSLGVTLEEIEAAGRDALVRAVIRWDPARVNKFGTTTSLATVVGWNVYAALNELHYAATTGRGRGWFGDDTGYEVAVLTEPARDVGTDPDAAESVAAVLSAIPDADRELLALRYGLKGAPWSLTDLGRRYGVTKEAVRLWIATALRRAHAVVDPSHKLLHRRVVDLLRAEAMPVSRIANRLSEPRYRIEEALRDLAAQDAVAPARGPRGWTVWLLKRKEQKDERHDSQDRR